MLTCGLEAAGGPHGACARPVSGRPRLCCPHIRGLPTPQKESLPWKNGNGPEHLCPEFRKVKTESSSIRNDLVFVSQLRLCRERGKGERETDTDRGTETETEVGREGGRVHFGAVGTQLWWS